VKIYTVMERELEHTLSKEIQVAMCSVQVVKHIARSAGLEVWCSKKNVTNVFITWQVKSFIHNYSGHFPLNLSRDLIRIKSCHGPEHPDEEKFNVDDVRVEIMLWVIINILVIIFFVIYFVFLSEFFYCCI